MGRHVVNQEPPAAGRLAGQGAVVTGSSTGIGRAVAFRLADEGAEVLCCDLRPEPRPEAWDAVDALPTHSAIQQRGGTAAFCECDVRAEASVEAAFGAADELSVPTSVYVLNAGVFAGDASILSETAAAHDLTLGVNERGVWLGCRAGARRLVAAGRPGRIVCIASISGLVGLANEPAYCASKGAVVSLVRAAAVDLARYRISVNAVCPGFVATAMLRPSLEDPIKRDQFARATPWPRLGRPADIAAAVLFLVSDDADWITGVALPVDGGYACR
jgi:hypothetical protein